MLLHPSVLWKRLTFSVPISLSSCPSRKLFRESQRLNSMLGRGILLHVFSVSVTACIFMYVFQPFGETFNAPLKSQENEIVLLFCFLSVLVSHSFFFSFICSASGAAGDS